MITNNSQNGRGGSRSIGQLVSDVLDTKLEKAGLSQRVMKLWFMVNGERERAHTVGVFLKENPTGQPPRLFVYVDSNACAVDFNASREVYLAKLEGAGLTLTAIDFRLSRYAQEHRERLRAQPDPEGESLPDLTEEEATYIDGLVKDLPERLRKSVSKAVSSSMRRKKAESS